MSQHGSPLDRPVVKCECGMQAELLFGSAVLPRSIDHARRLFWYCDACDAWTPAAPKTFEPEGVLHPHRIRQMKRKIVDAVDFLIDQKVQATGCWRRDAWAAAWSWINQETGSGLDGPAKLNKLGRQDIERIWEIVKPVRMKLKRELKKREKRGSGHQASK